MATADPAASELTGLLNQLKSTHPALSVVALISREGRFIASTTISTMQRVRLGATSAASAALGRKGSADLELGTMKHVHIQAENGSLVLVEVGDKALVALLLSGTADIDTVLREVSKVQARLRLLV